MMDVQPTSDPSSDSSHARERYEPMLRMRVIDDRLAALGESGAIGFLPRAAGREAALVGAVAALRETDWIFPTLADWAITVARGMSVETFVHRVFGDARDPLRGHDIPAGTSAKALHIGSASAPPATHLPHAVGVSWAARRRGEDVVAAALFDAREVDAAEFHTALNFGGVMKTPTLFICRVRAGEPGAAEHAVAYGLASAHCDGADVDAVVDTIGRAAERARAGEGPTVIDLELGGDDDAIEMATAALGSERQRALRADLDAELTRAIDEASKTGTPDLRSLFDDVYSGFENHLAAQLREARAGAAEIR